jgi:carbon storage regulator
MLVLSRKVGEQIVIGDNITVVVNKVAGNRISLGINAPSNVRIVRGVVTLAGRVDVPFGCRRCRPSCSMMSGARDLIGPDRFECRAAARDLPPWFVMQVLARPLARRLCITPADDFMQGEGYAANHRGRLEQHRMVQQERFLRGSRTVRQRSHLATSARAATRKTSKARSHIQSFGGECREDLITGNLANRRTRVSEGHLVIARGSPYLIHVDQLQ